MDRRHFLESSAAFVLAPALPRFSACVRRRDPIEELVRKLIDMPRDQVFARIEPLLRDGLSWRDLQAAVFHAGILEVRPRPVGFKLHAVLVVESLFQIAEAGTERQALAAVLWNLDDFKNSQARDVKEGDWHLPAAPNVGKSTGPEAAAKELRDALASGDPERADRAVTAAVRELPHDRLFEILWAVCIRDFGNLGHKPIFCSHVQRSLLRVGGARAEPAVRALVYGLTDGNGDRYLEEHAASAAVAAELSERGAAGRAMPAESLELARDLRPATPEESRARVAEAVRDGLHPRTIWDGFRLVAADMFARRPALLPVHPTTVTSALYYIHCTTRDEGTRRTAMLQAASWLSLYREALRLPAGPGGIDALVDVGEHEPTELAAVFEAPKPLRTRAYLEGGGSTAAFGEMLRATLLERGAREHHEPKYAAAILEDVRSADPRWHPALLASALEYLPSRATPVSPLAEETAALLDRVDR